MTTYPGTPAPATGPAVYPVCFTGSDATDIKLILGAAAAVGTAVVGVGIGWLIAWYWPDLVGKTVAMVVGAIVGGVLGLAYALKAFSGGSCPCPAPAQAVCICFFVFMTPGGTAIPLPPFFLPSCPACSLVPAGCP